MGINSRTRALSALLAVALIASMAVAASASALPARFWGVVPQSLLSEEQFQRLQQGGAKTMRVSFDWGGIQHDGRTAPMNWAAADALVERAVKANLEVLPFFSGAPRWAIPLAKVPGDPNAKAPAHLPAAGAAASAWSALLKAGVARYGPNGSFWAEHPSLPKRPIRTWQIWNEPNFKYFVAKPNPAEYGRLVKLSHTALKSADPGAQILLGGMFSYPKGCAKEKRPKSICAPDFLEQMYKKTPGVKTKFNAAALHPYTGNFQELRPYIQDFRTILAANKDAAKPLWITELGWSSQPLDPTRNIFAKGPGGQAQQLKGAFTLLRANAVKWKLKRLYWFSVDDAEGVCNFCPGSGLFGDGFVPKKAWYAFVKFAGGTP